MDTPGGLVDRLGQRIDIDRFQLSRAAILQNQRNDLMPRGQTLQLRLAGGVLPGRRLLRVILDLQFLIQHHTHLLWRVDIEIMTGQRKDLFLQTFDLLGQYVAVPT